MFATYKLNQCVAHLMQPHLAATHTLVKYLKETFEQDLLLKASKSFELHALGDANWASWLDTRKSTIEFYMFFSDFLVSWKLTKQTTVSKFSAKAEYRALAATISEL